MFVQFQLFTEQNRTLVVVDMPEVPVSGELVQIDNESYRVRGRGWVITSGRAAAWVILKPWKDGE